MGWACGAHESKRKCHLTSGNNKMNINKIELEEFDLIHLTIEATKSLL